MIPDFKGHHFVEDFKPGEPPSWHHCKRCGVKGMLKPDGSVEFVAGTGVSVRISSLVQVNIRLTPTCAS
jgi:hypothetical protein